MRGPSLWCVGDRLRGPTPVSAYGEAGKVWAGDANLLPPEAHVAQQRRDDPVARAALLGLAHYSHETIVNGMAGQQSISMGTKVYIGAFHTKLNSSSYLSSSTGRVFCAAGKKMTFVAYIFFSIHNKGG